MWTSRRPLAGLYTQMALLLGSKGASERARIPQDREAWTRRRRSGLALLLFPVNFPPFSG